MSCDEAFSRADRHRGGAGSYRLGEVTGAGWRSGRVDERVCTMTTIGWIILGILLIPAIGLLVWVVLSASFVRVPTGRNALLLVRGRPTDTTLPPGLHFIFALRRRMVVTYPSVELSYRLAEGERRSQFVALASDMRAQAFGAIDMAVTSDRPMRLFVQVRVEDGRRWGRSFFVGSDSTTSIRAELAAMRGLGGVTERVPSSESITSILLVADLTNAAPGRSGRLTVLSSALVK